MEAAKESAIKTVTLSIASSSLAFLSTDIYLPFMQVLSQTFNTAIANIQATITVFMIALALSNFITTPLADYFGRRKILLFGLTTACCGTLLLLIPSLPSFILGRIFQGIGAATGLSLSRVIIRDISRDEAHLAKMYSIYATILCIAPAASPLIGAYVQHHLGWQAVFILLASLYVLHISCVSRYFKETMRQEELATTRPSKLLAAIKKSIKNPYFVISSTMSAITFGLYIAYLTAVPYILQIQLKKSVITTGWAMSSIVLGGLSSRIINIYAIKKLARNSIFKLALGIQILSVVTYIGLQFLHIINVYSIMVPGIIHVFASGFLFTYYVTNAMSQFKQGLGSAAAIYSGIQVIGAVVLSAVVAMNHHNDMQLMSWLFGIGISTIIVLNLLRNHYHTQSAR